jgi:hypothetical protein
MKRIIITLCFLTTFFTIGAADITVGDIAFTAQPKNLQIPLHIASQTEIQSKMVAVSYDDTTVLRERGYHEDGAAVYPGGFNFNIGSSFPLLRIHPASNEDLGIGLKTSWMIPFVTDASWVAMSMEFVVDLGITVSPISGLAFGVSRKHICSHLLDRSLFTSGDNFLGVSSSDVDPQHGPMAIRDSIVFSFHVALEKLFNLDYENFTSSIYADYGYSLPGKDPLNDARYTRPSYMTSRYYQIGAQATHYFRFNNVDLGGVYIASNLSFYENSGYTQNTAFSVGYILPYSFANRKFMIDFSFYDGRAVNEEFYGHRERYTSVGLVLQQ